LHVPVVVRRVKRPFHQFDEHVKDFYVHVLGTVGEFATNGSNINIRQFVQSGAFVPCSSYGFHPKGFCGGGSIHHSIKSLSCFATAWPGWLQDLFV